MKLYFVQDEKKIESLSSFLNVCAIKMLGFIDKYLLTAGLGLLYFIAVTGHYAPFHHQSGYGALQPPKLGSFLNDYVTLF